MSGHIVDVMWSTAGRPDPNWQGKARTTRAAPEPRDGVCALTGAAGPVFDARHVVSDSFTGWDLFPFRTADPSGLGFSPAAAWALRHRLAMQRPHALTCGWFGELDPPALYAALRDLPDDPAGAVSVPTSGQKHLLPWCRPGTVRTDALTLPWAGVDVDRLGTYAALRQLGHGETALTEPAPRWAQLRKHDRAQRQWVLLRWPDLDPWRARPEYLDVAARATRTPKETT